jgi:putative DNA primase/helicase
MTTVLELEPKARKKRAEKQEATWKPDDDQIAIALATEWKSKVAFFHSEWKVYDDKAGVWDTRNSAEFRRHIRKELRNWRGQGVNVSQGRIKALEGMLEDDLFISDRFIMERQIEQRKYINLRNGMFNLETMELEPHKPDLYFTNRLDFDYDPDALCSTFNRYMMSSLVYPGSHKHDRSLYMLVMEALGYSLTARTDLKSSFWLVGEKDSGKSTFIALLRGLMGTLHTTLDLTQLGVNRFLLSGIVGKRVITFTEASGSAFLPDALYKTLVGGSDEVYADVKNRDPIAFRPEAKVWWAMNEMPRVNDRSGATTRRIHIIPFNRTIPENERISNLEALLMKERSGIFNEIIIYYKRLMKLGNFEPCAQANERRQQYISENDTEGTFIEECAVVHEAYWVQSTPLYISYKTWCEERGFRPKNYNQIADEWRRLGFTRTKKEGVSVWHGLKLRDSKN